MTDKEFAKRLAGLSDAFYEMCINRDCRGCEMEAFSVEGVCAHAWVWKRLREEEVRAETCGTLDSCPAAQKEEEAARVRSYSNEEAEAAAPNESPKAKEEVKLPKWVKEGQWVMTPSGSVAQIRDIGMISATVQFRDCILDFLIDDLKPIRFRAYSFEEAKGLLGKVMEYTFSTGSGYASNAILISRVSCRDDGDTFIHSCSFDDWVSYKATIDGVPIGVPEVDEEALKGGEE